MQRVGRFSGEAEGAAAAPRFASPSLSPLSSAPSLGSALPQPAAPSPPAGGLRRRCHGAAHAGVQRLLLGQPGFQGALEVSRDRAGEDQQVHQRAD